LAKGLFIIGTDTGVGKTVVSAGLMHLFLLKRYNACYFKPVSCGILDVENNPGPTDVLFVKAASGLKEEQRSINPFSFKAPVSPHLASRMEGRAIDVEVIKERLHDLKSRYDFIVAEGCGGLAVPLRDDGYLLSNLIVDLGFDCVLVARTGLGTINHTLLTVNYAQGSGIRIQGIIMNGYTQSSLEDDNCETLQRLTGLRVLGIVPALQGADVDKLMIGNLRDVFEKTIDIEEFIKVMGDL
jgi:dethiobiotin synthetase